MKCYTVGHINITNMEGYKVYGAAVPATIAKHGGKYLCRGGDYTLVEGSMENDRHVVIEWPSRAVAEGWYNSPEYQAIIRHRLDNSSGDLLLVDGYEG